MAGSGGGGGRGGGGAGGDRTKPDRGGRRAGVSDRRGAGDGRARWPFYGDFDAAVHTKILFGGSCGVVGGGAMVVVVVVIATAATASATVAAVIVAEALNSDLNSNLEETERREGRISQSTSARSCCSLES